MLKALFLIFFFFLNLQWVFIFYPSAIIAFENLVVRSWGLHNQTCVFNVSSCVEKVLSRGIWSGGDMSGTSLLQMFREKIIVTWSSMVVV